MDSLNTWLVNFLRYHLYCSICNKLFSGDVDSCLTPGCQGKKEKTNNNYFITGSLKTQLAEILEREGVWDTLQEYSSSRSHGTISDILDGEEYKKLKEPGGFMSNTKQYNSVIIH